MTVNYGFTQQLSYCPTVCSLLEADNQNATHPAITAFDDDIAKVVISTSDGELIGSVLTLQVICESTLSEKTNSVSDLFTVKFEDPCQFDSVEFEN